MIGGHTMTARDRVWAAVLLLALTPGTTQFKIRDVQFRMSDLGVDRDDRPSRETVRRALSAGTDLGILKHRSGSPWWRFNDRAGRTVLTVP